MNIGGLTASGDVISLTRPFLFVIERLAKMLLN